MIAPVVIGLKIAGIALGATAVVGTGAYFLEPNFKNAVNDTVSTVTGNCNEGTDCYMRKILEEELEKKGPENEAETWAFDYEKDARSKDFDRQQEACNNIANDDSIVAPEEELQKIREITKQYQIKNGWTDNILEGAIDAYITHANNQYAIYLSHQCLVELSKDQEFGDSLRSYVERYSENPLYSEILPGILENSQPLNP